MTLLMVCSIAQVTHAAATGPSEGAKGSLLVFPSIELRWNQNGNLLQDTFLRISNDFPEDVHVHIYFLNGDPPIPSTPGAPAEPGWNFYDNVILLTNDQPMYWSALSGGGLVAPFTTLDPGLPPGRPEPLPNSTARVLRGAAFAWAEAYDAQSDEYHEISWNHLKGDATIVNYQWGYVSEYGAYSFPTVITDQNGVEPDGVPGRLLLDGGEYVAPYERLLFDFAAGGSQAWSSDNQLAIAGGQLTVMPVGMDFRQDGNGPIVAQVDFNVFNENEVLFSGGRCVTCWDERITTGYTPDLFSAAILGSDVGRASIEGVSALTDCVGISNDVVPLLAIQTHRLAFLGAPLGVRLDNASSTVAGSGQKPAVIRFDPVPGQGEANNDADAGHIQTGISSRLVQPIEPLPPETPFAIEDRAGLNHPGSLLVFPKVELRWSSDGRTLLEDTFIQINNDFAGPVKLKLVFVNGEPPLPLQGEPGWNHQESIIQLTQNQPVYWSALAGPPGGTPFADLDPSFPPGRPDPDGSTNRVLRGYMLAWAIDDGSGFEINWNHLTGRATTVNYQYGFAWDYPAYAHRAISGAHGEETDATQSQLLLDGTEYDSASSHLVFNFQSSYSEAFSNPGYYAISDTELVLMPLGLDLSPVTGFPTNTKARFDIWNENEIRFSGAEYCITCWSLKFLGNIASPNYFLFSTLQTDAAKARVDGVQSATCPGSTSYPLVGTIAKHVVMDIGNTVVTAAGTTLAGSGIQSATIGEQLCSSESACSDNNSCTCNHCSLQYCSYTPVRFGNVNCSANQLPNVDDVLCVLNGFSSFAACPNGDIAPTTGPHACWGNRLIDLDDILAVLGAFAGADPCACNP